MMEQIEGNEDEREASSVQTRYKNRAIIKR